MPVKLRSLHRELQVHLQQMHAVLVNINRTGKNLDAGKQTSRSGRIRGTRKVYLQLPQCDLGGGCK